MPSIFHRVDGQWHAARLATAHAVLSFSPVRVDVLAAAGLHLSRATIALMRPAPGRKWMAIVSDDLPITHNGLPVAAGLRVLAHGDSLAAAHGDCVFFSAEETACIESFAADEPVTCPRCRTAIERGQAVVRCPACSVVHHEIAERHCWTYGASCSLCDQPTPLDSALRWSPEAL